MKSSDYLAIVPARGGSKRITDKNIINIMGKPLIHYTLEVSTKITGMTTIVSSDSDRILEIASYYDIVKHKRPAMFSTDDSDIFCVIKDVINSLDSATLPDSVILLQPTSPLRTLEDLQNAIFTYENSESEMLVSVTELEKSLFKILYLNKDGFINGLFDKVAPFVRKQDCPRIMSANGAIYIFSVKSILNNDRLIMENAIPFLMSKENSVDVDLQKDIDIIEGILRK